MLTKIPIKELAIGMYIEKLDGSWIKHPFWKKSFLLKSSKDLSTLKNSKITHVWIDDKKSIKTKQPSSTLTPTPNPEEKKPDTKFVKLAIEEEICLNKPAWAIQLTLPMLPH